MRASQNKKPAKSRVNIIEETPVTKHIQKTKTEQNTLMNTEREREVTNFKLLVSPIHCVVF